MCVLCLLGVAMAMCLAVCLCVMVCLPMWVYLGEWMYLSIYLQPMCQLPATLNITTMLYTPRNYWSIGVSTYRYPPPLSVTFITCRILSLIGDNLRTTDTLRHYYSLNYYSHLREGVRSLFTTGSWPYPKKLLTFL